MSIIVSVIQLIVGDMLGRNKTADPGKSGDGERVVESEDGSLIVRINTII